ncbi:MAG: ice-binding family protein [Burkholderiaceae bacterium]|nr:ice-binding family protein [Burkholderiaceae bacterium]
MTTLLRTMGLDPCTAAPAAALPARSRFKPWLGAVLLGLFMTACGGGGGGRDPILGADVVAPVTPGGVVVVPVPTPVPPTVTAVAPVNNATGVAINNTLITAAFSEPVAAFGVDGASFVVTCAAPCVNPGGTVALDSTKKIATLSLPSGTTLGTSTVYTGTIIGAKSLATGLAMATPYVWQFTTGVTPDTTRPRVVITVPATTTPGPTPAVAANTAITAVFTEDMAPATISSASFSITCAAPCVTPAGTVTYVAGNRTAIFTPAAPLAASTNYTVTVNTTATDLAGNALAGNQAALPAASNYVWSFTTAAAVPAANVSVLSTNPLANATGICPAATVNATFNVPSGLRMDPASITSAVFTVTGPGLTSVVAASVLLDGGTGRIATFTPQAPLVAGVQYTATVRGGASGAKDLAIPANTMLADSTWTFTVASCAVVPTPPAVALGAASSFGTFGGSAGMTNQGIRTIVNGDIGTTAVSTAVTGFHDAGPGCIYTETTLNVGTVNGLIYTAAPPPTVACPSEGTATTFALATQARADALAAYNTLVAMPGGPDPGAGNLGSLVLAPGVYTAASGSFLIRGGDLTLDAQGNANAVWVFQMATSLTVGGPGAAFPQSVILANGAQAKNVYWQVGSAATINAGGGGTMVGTIISQSGVSISTAGAGALTRLEGRALSLGASVTMVDSIINVPAP